MEEAGTLLDKLDILIERGFYKDRDMLMKDAMQSLLRSKPELRRQLAIELYKEEKISLSRAAEIGGVDIESFKELLRESGIIRMVPHVEKAIGGEVERLLELRETK